MAISSNPIVTGYYRWTDIKHAWKDVLEDHGDGNPLAAALSYEGLVHPDHPLHMKGVDGIQLYQGTFANGELKLLFSSKQVDYLRYWLHAMQLTKEILPLPYSNALLIESNLRNIAPVVYASADALKQGFKTIEKLNKKLKRANPLLHSRRHQFNLVRTYWGGKQGSWLSIDLEAWEYDHTALTEFGYSLVWFVDGWEKREVGHYLIEEHCQYRNGNYVADNSELFDFGESEVVSGRQLRSIVASLFKRCRENGPVYLIFHDASQDMKYLQSDAIQAPLSGYSYALPEVPPDSGLYIIDTTELFAALEGEGKENKRSLETMCRLLDIETFHLHNAGNDAYFTLLALETIVGGEDIETQRAERWPNRKAENLKVQFEPYDEDPDYDDQEGVFGLPSVKMEFGEPEHLIVPIDPTY